jgi:hypothetical protein
LRSAKIGLIEQACLWRGAADGLKIFRSPHQFLIKISSRCGVEKAGSFYVQITNSKSLITNHQSQITNHKSPITNHQSRITNHKSPIANHQSQITKYKSPITNHPSQITNHKSPITNHKSPTRFHFQLREKLRFCWSISSPQAGTYGIKP